MNQVRDDIKVTVKAKRHLADGPLTHKGWNKHEGRALMSTFGFLLSPRPPA